MIQRREQCELKLDCAESISILDMDFVPGDKLIGVLIGGV